MEAPQDGSSGQKLTIFYSGTVNVFHHVPAHKAQAIVLLLSDDRSSSNHSVLDCTTNSLKQTQQPQPSKIGAVHQGANASYPPSYCCPSQSQPPTRLWTPTTDSIQIAQSIKKQSPLISKRSQAELPFARKASLARFLEKRNDRVLDAKKRNQDVNACADDDDGHGCGSPCKRMKL